MSELESQHVPVADHDCHMHGSLVVISAGRSRLRQSESGRARPVFPHIVCPIVYQPFRIMQQPEHTDLDTTLHRPVHHHISSLAIQSFLWQTISAAPLWCVIRSMSAMA
jgi:hypothetical protein